MSIYLVLERWGSEFVAAFTTRELANDFAGEFDVVYEYILDDGFPISA